MDMIILGLTNTFNLFVGTVLPFLFVLTIVVFVHEMGHYLVGRWCGVGVTHFSLGFGPEVVGWNDKSGTRWKVSAIPLGGYVKFHGDENEASVPDVEGMKNLTPLQKETHFHTKAVWKRALVVVAGPVANFILAIAIFTTLFYIKGEEYLVPRIESVVEGSVAEKAGFRAGDIITSINDDEIKKFSELQRTVSIHAGENLRFSVERAGQIIPLQATPLMREIKTSLGVQRIGQLGIVATKNPDDIKQDNYTLFQAFKVGVGETYFIVERTFDYIGKLFAGRESTDQLSGPLRIAQASGEVAQVGFMAIMSLTALLSVSIGLINLFPIPLLDGGHLVFYAYEAIRGKPMGPKVQEWGFRIGLGFVALLMVVSTWNDIVHIGSNFVKMGS
jgi:regulator of sigma E protease